MAWQAKELESYRVYLNPRATTPGRALVDVRPVTGGAYWLWFAGAPLPANEIGTTTGTAYFPFDMLTTVIELLRTERPVFIQVDADRDELRLTTTQEPLGEGPVDAP
jgi:hypothetical protein